MSISQGLEKKLTNPEERPATRLQFVSTRIELEIFRVESSRVDYFSSRVESSWVFYKGNENKEQRKKRKLDSTRLDSKNICSTRLDSTRAGL
jgi:hypothetical protein